MAKLIKIGQIYGRGGSTLTLTASLFAKDDNYSVPASIRIPTSGTFTNCSRLNSLSLTLSNPSTDTTFEFPVEYSEDELTWYATQITGSVLLKSLPQTNITTTLIRNTIGESTNKVKLLCTSTKVNRCSLYCPSGSAPYKMGDFRGYTHGATCGTFVSHVAPTLKVGWGDDITIIGLASRKFKETAGKPYANSRVVIYQASTLRAETTVNFNTDPTAIVKYTVYGGKPSSETTTTWTVKTEHYNGSSWVEGTVDTFTVTQAGQPWSVSVNSGYPVRELDTATVMFDFTSGLTLKIRFSVQISGTWFYVEADFTTGTGLVLDYVHASNIPAGSAWRLQVEYPYGTGIWNTEASGTL